jgi:hypothetical protein
MENKTPEELLKDPNLSKNSSESDVVTRMAEASSLAENPEVVKEVLKYGKVPVNYRPTKEMLRKPAEPGLLTLIANATTEREVNNLVEKGKSGYENVHQSTVRKWEKAAKKRISQLSR